MNDETNRLQSGEHPTTAHVHENSDTIGSQIGPYKLLQQIGEGGMGTVYMAQQEKPVQRRVALKIIKAGMDSKQVVARFEAERQALSMMDHQNIAHVLDVGTTEKGRPYFVMELIRGLPITRYCDQKNLTIQERLQLFLSTCHAVQHAHQKGIIHRDLKPSNILVADYDGKPSPKIIDFGLAKALHQRLTDKTMFTELGQVVGTLDYMSPEQSSMNQLEVDTRTDIYSLGVLLYELLTGTVPFDKKRLRSGAWDQVLKIIREEEPPKPSHRLSTVESSAEIAAHRSVELKRLGPLLRGELDWIVMKAMEKDRDRRFETANGLAMDIERYVKGEPVLAVPPSAGYRLKKFIRRNRAAVVAASLVIAVMLIGITGTTWGMIWARKEQARVAAQAESASAALRAANDIVIQTIDELADDFGDETRRELPINDTSEYAGMEVDALGTATKNLAVFLSRSLKEEARSREVAEQTAKELEHVARFQADQLSGIDVPSMAVRLRSDLLNRIRASATVSRLEPAVIETRVSEAERLVAGADFTGIALATLEENVFDRALEAIESEFVDQPLVKARLLQTVSETVRELGLLTFAKAPQAEALDIRRRLLGDTHTLTLDSIFNTGRLLHQQRMADKAEPFFREALEGRRRLLGDDHPDTLQSLNWLGNSLNHQSKLAEAEEYLREALDGKVRVLGDDHPNTLEAYNDLGVSLKLQNRFEEAKHNYELALDGLRRVLGDDHPWTLTSIHNMGRLLGDEDLFIEAEVYYREALDRRRRVLGDDHPLTLSSFHWMGTVLLKQGKHEQAEPYYREAVDGRRRILGGDHQDTLISMLRMASLLLDQDKLVEAVELYKQALEIRRHLSGDDDDATLAATRTLARILEGQDKYDEAEPYYRESLAIRRRKIGDDDPETLMGIVWLAHVLERQGSRDEAKLLFSEALTGQRRVLGQEHKNTLTTMWGLGRTLIGLSEHVEAEELLRECLAGRTHILEQGHWHLFNTRSLLAESIVGQGRFAEAEPMLIEAHEKMKPPAQSAQYTVDNLHRLISLYEAWDKAEPDNGYDTKASRWREELKKKRQPD